MTGFILMRNEIPLNYVGVHRDLLSPWQDWLNYDPGTTNLHPMAKQCFQDFDTTRTDILIIISKSD